MWREAFFRQARSDFEMFRELNRPGRPLCHKLRYLQMAMEKLAKAFLCSRTEGPPKRTHFALTRFLQLSKGMPQLRREPGCPETNYRACVAYIDSLVPTARRIEALAPATASPEGVNVEYPWQTDAGDVVSPVDCRFPELSRTELSKFVVPAANLFRAYERI